jgi:hypothetical protein
MRQRNACHGHNLWHAVSLALSADNRSVYCRCGCGRFRQVPRADWEAEMRRRQQGTPPREPLTPARERRTA